LGTSKRSERWYNNKKAFDEIIGDPFAHTEEGPEPIQGHYTSLKNGSGIKVATIDQMPGSSNPARPNALDFFIDVDSAVADGLDTIGRNLGEIFMNTYFYEDPSRPIFKLRQRSKIEQAIGHIFIKRMISPVGRYFTAIRQ
jgi:hypothetical protein